MPRGLGNLGRTTRRALLCNSPHLVVEMESNKEEEEEEEITTVEVLL